jgi:hypothetical protein
MKAYFLGIILALAAAPLWAQAPATPPTPPPPSTHQMHHDMMTRHMEQMQAQVDKMRATLEQMKANLSKITDPAARQQAQLNVDLWEAMVHHMEVMTHMMAPHGGMDMGGMHAPAPATEKPAEPQK